MFQLGTYSKMNELMNSCFNLIDDKNDYLTWLCASTEVMFLET
jgi:hypothetical protein